MWDPIVWDPTRMGPYRVGSYRYRIGLVPCVAPHREGQPCVTLSCGGAYRVGGPVVWHLQWDPYRARL